MFMYVIGISYHIHKEAGNHARRDVYENRH